MRDPNKVSESLKTWSRSPYLLWLIWLIWLPFGVLPTVELIQLNPPLPRLIIILIGIALFIGLYLWATWRSAQYLATSLPPGHTEVSTWLMIAVLTALSIVLTLLGGLDGNDFLEPFVFTSAYVGGSLPTVWAVQAVVALTLLTSVGRLIDLSWLDLEQGNVYIAVIGIVVIGIVRSIRASRELRVAREEIARLAVMTERLRIARDLHDLLGHNLSLITLKSELAGRLVGLAPEKAVTEISDIEHVARTTLQEVREAVTGYRQPTLSNELYAAQEILFAAGIAYRYDMDEGMLDALPPAIEAILAWTVREGVTNVIRHSRAHQCRIRVIRDGHDASIEVSDDGVVVPPVTALQPQDVASTGGSGNGGNGLRGLAERVETLGGRCEARLRADGGFRLAVSVPLAQRDQAAGVSTASGVQRMPVVPLESNGSYEERSEQL